MNWNTLQKLSEKWATFYLRGVFEAIAYVFLTVLKLFSNMSFDLAPPWALMT